MRCVYVRPTCRCWIVYTPGPVQSLYVDTHEPSLVVRRARFSLQYASKIKWERDVAQR